MMPHHIVARIQGMIPEPEPHQYLNEVAADRQRGRRRSLRRPLRRRTEER
jgi:hypothetical protein